LNSSGCIVLKLVCEESIILEHWHMLGHACMLPASLYPFWVSVHDPLSEALCFHLVVISQAAQFTVRLHLFNETPDS